MSVYDYIPKNKEAINCPISDAATGRMVVQGLYKNSTVAWREAVSNACDAMRHSEIKQVKVYSNIEGDGVIEDWGTGIEDNDHFARFIGIGRIKSDKTDDVNERDDREIGRFGVGKNSYLGLSKIKLVQFRSHSEKDGIRRGMVVTLFQEQDDPERGIQGGTVKYFPPDYMDSENALKHRGMKVIIRQLVKPMTTAKLIDYLSKRFALKIARRYKIFVDDKPVYKPDNFYCDKQVTLFRLDNGIEVYGQLKVVDKNKINNIDILVNQVFIEAQDFEYKCEGWINCDELNLTTSREGISTDENTVYPEFNRKLREYLSKNFDPRDKEEQKTVHEKEWERIAAEAITKYFKIFQDDTVPFLQGLAGKLGIPGNPVAPKGGQIWKVLQNSGLAKLKDSQEGEDIEVKRVKKKKTKRRKKNKKKLPGNGETNSDPKYEIIPGKGLVAVKAQEDEGSEEADEFTPSIKFMHIPTNRDKPICYWHDNEKAFIINTAHPGAAMYSDPNSEGACHETYRAIIKAIPENISLSLEEFDKKFYGLIDAMVESEQ